MIKILNPTCSGGGHIVPALQKTCSCSSLFGLRDPKFWYNSYIIVTLDVLNLWNQKCVSKKIGACFLMQVSKIKSSKMEKWPRKLSYKLRIQKIRNFCFLDNVYLGLYLKDMAVIVIFLIFCEIFVFSKARYEYFWTLFGLLFDLMPKVPFKHVY